MKHKTQFRIWWVHWMLAPFGWSRWTDIQTFGYDGDAFLLQGKVNRSSNAKKFRITCTKKSYRLANVSNVSMDRLNECGLADEHVKWNS